MTSSNDTWTQPGIFRVGDGIYRIPLPLPNDALKAVNVYALEDEHGLVLVDGGWDLGKALDQLTAGLGEIGRRVEDIQKVLVTHAHRDHYTQAVAIRRLSKAKVYLGTLERRTVELYHGADGRHMGERLGRLRQGGAGDLADKLIAAGALRAADPTKWENPDEWLEDGSEIRLPGRTLTALHTPGHTQGHLVYREPATQVLFGGDHVLPHITPSIGFEPAVTENALANYLASLTRIRDLPDARLLPAHGPVTESAHERVAELLRHHQERLALAKDAVETGDRTAAEVARHLPWTRRGSAFDTLDPFNQMLAVNETAAHLDVLVARAQLQASEHEGIRFYISLSAE
jgi:glyoxylase-like metal-dependent hydrolase (beta-lactamase superfamily II)